MATVDKKHPGRNLVYAVLTLTTKNRLIGHCIEGNEEWGEIVKARLEHDIYLVAEEAIYHNTCQKVYSKKKITSERPGPPRDMAMANNFNNLCLWLDNELEPTTFLITKLHSFW